MAIHHRSPFQAVFDEEVEVAGANAPLRAELRGRQFSYLNLAADRLL